ncbi:unnamed protein product [Rhizophagus irregularis]|nr:unnamed protein product [Rhizophagus irregularis]
MHGNSNIHSILQELVTEDFILEQKIEINGLSLDIPLDTVTLYFNKIKSNKDKVSAPTLRSSVLEESCLQTSSKSVKSVEPNSQIQSLKNQLLELNNYEIDLKKNCKIIWTYKRR